MKAKLRGTEIFYDIMGEQYSVKDHDFTKKPVLFLLHGGPGGCHIGYKIHSAALQKVAQLVMIDHRGCGLSKKTKQSDYTLDNNIEDIEALRKHLGLEKICLLGTSYGGIVAQGYAIRYPKRVEKLILVVTAPSFRFREAAKKILAKRGTPQQIKWCEHLWQGDFKSPAHVKKFFTVMESLYSKNLKKTIFPKMKIPYAHEALNEGFSTFLRRFDFIKKLHRIKAKTLVIAGKYDWICPPPESRVIAKHIPNAVLKIFQRSAHSVSTDENKKYLKVITNFLRANN